MYYSSCIWYIINKKSNSKTIEYIKLSLYSYKESLNNKVTDLKLILTYYISHLLSNLRTTNKQECLLKPYFVKIALHYCFVTQSIENFIKSDGDNIYCKTYQRKENIPVTCYPPTFLLHGTYYDMIGGHLDRLDQIYLGYRRIKRTERL